MKDLHYISETERWIPEWIGYYSINTSGVITSYHYDYPYIMSNVPENRSVKVFGQHVQLRYHQEPYTINVARTMYELFVRPLKKSELVVPANGDSNDLRLDNIRIIDRKYINLKKITLLNIETEELIEMFGYEECEKYNLSQCSLRCKIYAAKKKGLDYFTLKGQTWLYEVERYYKAA